MEPTALAKAIATGATPAVLQNKEEWMSSVIGKLNHLPITFYGKIVDQNGQAVVGADVKGGVMVQKGWMDGNIVDYWAQTDSSGNFVFTGIKGQDITIWAKKDGYYPFNQRAHKSTFYYSAMWKESDRHKPDPKNPVVFTMWKLKGPEPMLHYDRYYKKIVLDGTPLAINLLDKRRNETRGDLIIKAVRDPVEIVDENQRFSWQVTIEAVDGGLIEYDPAAVIYPNEAPADGYQPSLTYTMQADAAEWARDFNKCFFFTTRYGRVYGRCSIETNLITQFRNAKPSESMVEIELFANPNGSRNLEYDRAKDIRNPWPPSAIK